MLRNELYGMIHIPRLKDENATELFLGFRIGTIRSCDFAVLSAADLDAVVLADGELTGFAFTEPGEVANLVTPLLARRIAACLDAVAAGTVAALENGSPAA